MSDFDNAFKHVIGLEGGYVNDRADPGGETKYGVSIHAYPTLDIKNLTLEQAKQIYLADYWLKAQCDRFTYPLNVYLFDAAINQGVYTAIRLLQTAAKVEPDGVLGPASMKAIVGDPDIAHKFMAARAIRYMGTINFDRYGKGWLKRIFKLAREA